MTNMLCNRDCFNCVHDDCVLDEVSDAESLAADRRDAEARRENAKSDYYKAYYRANAPRLREKSRAKYKANKERALEYQREYRKTHRERVNARERAYREANREKRRAQAKEGGEGTETQEATQDQQ